jgi:hypothetical protein
MTFKKGTKVIIEADGRTVDGDVILASKDGISLMLEFEAVLYGHAGSMPVIRQTDGTYRSLFGHHVLVHSKPEGRPS